MNTFSRLRRVLNRTLGLAVLLALILVSQVQAAPLVEFTGYTRPANVDLKESRPLPKEVPAAQGKRNPREIGGTVYFMVLDRAKGTADDPWGSGMKDFATRFRVSRDSPSSKIDTTARFLYLYQVVNDSGADGFVYRASVRLLIDPRLVTSWGHFGEREQNRVRGVSFAMTFDGKKGDEGNILPVAAVPDRQGVTTRDYRPRAPRHLAPQVYDFRSILLLRGDERAVANDEIGREPDKVLLVNDARFDDNLSRKGEDIWQPRYQLPRDVGGDKRLAPVGPWREYNWAEDVRIRAVNDRLLRGEDSSGRTPASDRTARQTPQNIMWPVIRAYWQEDPLAPGERSTLFGFTSDHPPVYDAVQLTDNVSALPVRPAADNGGNAGVVPAVAPAATGTVPTPIVLAADTVSPPAPATPVAATAGTGATGGGVGGLGPAIGGLGGMPAGFGAGGGTGGGMMAGTGGGALGGGGAMGGGGATGGGGNGNGNGDPKPPPNGNGKDQDTTGQTQVQQVSQEGAATSTTGTTVTINNNNVNLSNASAVAKQSQSQSQKQKQSQKQSQTQTQTQIIPAPPAWVLGLLGLPVFYALSRRRKTPQQIEQTESA